MGFSLKSNNRLDNVNSSGARYLLSAHRDHVLDFLSGLQLVLELLFYRDIESLVGFKIHQLDLGPHRRHYLRLPLVDQRHLYLVLDRIDDASLAPVENPHTLYPGLGLSVLPWLRGRDAHDLAWLI